MSFSFSADGYRGIISHAREAGYSMIPMRACSIAEADSPMMILRHDVDLSLDFAVEMAAIEAGLGVQSTYFILPQNEYYNPFSTVGVRRVQEIAALGHEIGLHWDSSIHENDNERMRQGFISDLARLADIAGAEIVSASQHIPIDTPVFDVTELITYEAYSSRISARYRYVSDSAMAWRNETVWDLIDTGIDIQFLAHPIWWMAEGLSLRDKLAEFKIRSPAQLHTTIDKFADYVERCLADREQLDDALSAKWAGRKP